jgi:hypothetical protein
MVFPVMKERGPVKILCDEIGFQFDERMETTEVLLSFVRVLVEHVCCMRDIQERIAGVTGKAPSPESLGVLTRVVEMLNSNDHSSLIEKAADCHDLTHQPDDGPCDRYIDMLSSCISAVRFGLDMPCRSRHAAEAASHVWEKKYGCTLFDANTSRWKREWACEQLQEALLRLMWPAQAA